ncbi:hypothetical protein [Kribbella sp. NPDC004536]|uniref:hypothetical protein n=1 Tax=Kribbella sp. NPDC004536 TaxID=3364106 RepID=UPI003680C9E5
MKSAEVDLPQGDGKRVLTVDGPTRPTSKVVRLDASQWRHTSGTFEYSGQEFSVDITATAHTYGAAAIGRTLPTDLPPGTFDSDGKRVTPADLDAKASCARASAPKGT